TGTTAGPVRPQRGQGVRRRGTRYCRRTGRDRSHARTCGARGRDQARRTDPRDRFEPAAMTALAGVSGSLFPGRFLADWLTRDPAVRALIERQEDARRRFLGWWRRA